MTVMNTTAHGVLPMRVMLCLGSCSTLARQLPCSGKAQSERLPLQPQRGRAKSRQQHHVQRLRQKRVAATASPQTAEEEVVQALSPLQDFLVWLLSNGGH